MGDDNLKEWIEKLNELLKQDPNNRYVLKSFGEIYKNMDKSYLKAVKYFN